MSFSPQKKSTIFSGNQNLIFGQKMKISNSVLVSGSYLSLSWLICSAVIAYLDNTCRPHTCPQNILITGHVILGCVFGNITEKVCGGICQLEFVATLVCLLDAWRQPKVFNGFDDAGRGTFSGWKRDWRKNIFATLIIVNLGATIFAILLVHQWIGVF